MRVVIVDDEPPARARLARLLQINSALELVGEAASGVAALEVFTAARPDAAFLDVQMPDLTGFDVLAALPPERRPLVVFVTAYDRYALDAFEASAVDYLLKPVDPARLERAVTRLLARDSHAHVARLLSDLQRGPHPQRIVGRRDGTFHVLPLHTVEAFVTEGEQVIAVTDTGRYPVDSTLKDLEARLSPRAFLRIHKQALVSLDRLTAFEPCPDGSARATLASGRTLPVSRRCAHVLRHHLNGH